MKISDDHLIPLALAGFAIHRTPSVGRESLDRAT